MNKKDYLQLSAFVLGCEAAGIIGSFFTASQIGAWYATLARPAIWPPNWVFGPVWTTLFLLMGIAAYLVWKKRNVNNHVYEALTFFGVQLALNMLWSYLFFDKHLIGVAFIEIAVLWLAILMTIFKFWPISKKAAYLLVPYLLWVSFASYLNFYLLQLN